MTAPNKRKSHRFTNCPRCTHPLQSTLSLAGTPSEYYLECSNPKCNTFVDTYIPMPHQFAVHQTPTKFIGNFGAFGTGKTTASRKELQKHCYITPKANALVGANVTSQYEQTLKREFDNDTPAAFIKHASVQKAFYDLINGARIMFRPFDSASKLRSYNLTFFVMIEASECDQDAYHQLKTRLRNTAATTPLTTPDGLPIYLPTDTPGHSVPAIEHDWRKGIVESNPDAGWIRTQVLMVSQAIHKHGNIMDEYHPLPHQIDSNTTSHVSSTSANPHLPPSYIQEISANKPAWWVARYVFGSFAYSEGLVYPSAGACVIPAFDPPMNWPRLLACDYGLNDNFVYLLAAVDEANSMVHIYKEYVTNNRSMDDLAAAYFEMIKGLPSGCWYTQPILDPMSGARRDYDKKDLYTHFLDYGIYFKPGHKALDARIYRTNTYIESGHLKIHDCCQILTEELSDYKFPPRTLNDRNVNYNKPIDKNNHCINPMEWICMELPNKPTHLALQAFDRYGAPTIKTEEEKKKEFSVFALSDSTPHNPEVFDIQGGFSW